MLEDTEMQPEIDWQVLSFTPPPEEDNRQHREFRVSITCLNLLMNTGCFTETYIGSVTHI